MRERAREASDATDKKLRLTRAERLLVQHVVRGRLLDLSNGLPTTNDRRSAIGTGRPGRVLAAQLQKKSRTVRAPVIREILRGRYARDPDPQGIRLKGAWIAGQLDLDNVQTDVDLWLYDCYLAGGITAWSARLPSLGLEGCWIDGEVNLAGTQLGMLACSEATLRNKMGPALYANGIRVEHGLVLGGGFNAEGEGNAGAVHLSGANVGGWINFSNSRIRNATGPALQATHLLAGGLRLDKGFQAEGAGSDVVVDLGRASVGTLVFDPDRIEHLTDPQARLRIDGLTYTGLAEGIGLQQWLRLLRDATPVFTAQPYQQLAATYRAAGHDGEARKVLMSQRRDQIRRKALTGRADRAWARVTGLTLGYGYQSWRALLGLFVIITTAALLAGFLGAQGGLARLPIAGTPGVPCTPVERLGVGFSYGIPVLKSIAQRCETTNTTAGQLLAGGGWLLQLLAWGFATLFIAGLTGAVRKP